MPELTQGDKDFLAQVSGFAARHAINGVFMTTVYSQALSLPVVMIIALGDQATAVQHLLLSAQAPVESGVEVVSNLDAIDKEGGKW